MINPSALATQFVAMERYEQDLYYSNKMDDIESQQAAWDEISTCLTALQDAANVLTAPSDGMNSMIGTSSDESVSVTAGEGAINGSYTFHVDQIAQAQQTDLEFPAGATLPTTGVYTFTSSSGTPPQTMTIDMAALTANNGGQAPTLQQVADSINSNPSNFGVNAQVMTDSSGNQHLLVASDETGVENGFSITNTSGAAVGTELTGAQDAQITIGSGPNAFSITSASNQMTNVIPGVTINLTSGSVGQDITIGVEADEAAMAEDVTNFLTAYNSLFDSFKRLGGYSTDESGNTSEGPLSGNSTLRSMENAIKKATKQEVGGLTFAEIGITTDENGYLVLDSEKFNAAVANDPQAVQDLVTEVSNDIDDLVSGYTTTGGPIYVAQDRLTMSKMELEKDMADYDQRMEYKYEQYVKEFTEMNQIMQTMQATSAMFG